VEIWKALQDGRLGESSLKLEAFLSIIL